MATKTQRIVISVVAAFVVLGGGYVLGNHKVFNTQPVVAETTMPIESSSADSDTSNVDSAMIVSAVNYYLGEKNLAVDKSKITHLNIDGDSARGRLKNADSGSVFYANKEKGEWTVVVSGQTALSQADATTYGFPADWVGKTTWSQ